MSNLFDSLSSATSGLTAARLGIDVAGQNLANINTPGYSRRTMIVSDIPPITPISAGRGVSIDGVRAERDRFVLSRMNREQMGVGFDEAVIAGLQEVEAAVGQPGGSLDARLTAFFDAFSALAIDTTSFAQREQVVQQADELARAFGQLAGRLTQVQRTVEGQLADAVAEINTLATEVARLNDRISAGGSDADALVDRRDVALAKLSALATIHVIATPDGAVNVAIGQGRPLVTGISTHAVTLAPSAVPGLSAVVSEGIDLTTQMTGGRIGGLLHVRDGLVPGYAAALDQLAFDLATGVNALHQSGVDADGNVGGAVFLLPATAAGAASQIAIDPALAANSRRVAASATGASGDNQIARAIAALRDAQLVGGTLTPVDAWARLVYQAGSDLVTTRGSAETRDQIMRQLQQLRDQVSAVSIDEEAANLMRYERAYQANARYFTTVVSLLDELMEMVP